MADLKISQLTGATTPLTGTEVLPIVQSSSTKKVSIDNLTAGKEVPAMKVTVSTGADALSIYIKGRSADNQSNIFFVNSADSVQYGYINANASEMVVSTIGARPLSLGVAGTTAFQVSTAGNLVPVGAAKGVNFTANTPAAGMTSQLLNWYEEGTWTPATRTAGGTYTTQVGTYIRVGKLVTLFANVAWSAHSGAGSDLEIGGFPFVNSSGNTFQPGAIAGNLTLSAGESISSYILPNTSYIKVLRHTNLTGADASYLIPAAANITIWCSYIAA